MKLDLCKFKEDESKSNPMAVAMAYPDCPIGRPCFHVAVGPGTPLEVCPHFKDFSDEAECTQAQTTEGA